MASSSSQFAATLAPTLRSFASLASSSPGSPSKHRPSELWCCAALALLRLSPRECESVGLLFEEILSNDVRGLIVELLAGAGTFEAQVVLRRLLSLAVARADNTLYASYVQRLGAVIEPDGPTLRFLMSVYFESRQEPPHIRAACAYALGASAGQAAKVGDLDAAVRATDVLRRDLRDASTVGEKCALLTALGNAGLATDAAMLLELTTEADGAVRAAATLALRKITTADVRRALVRLLADREAKVANGAVVALSEQRLEAEELERLAELILGGRTNLDLDARLLGFISAQRPRSSASLEKAVRLLIGRVGELRISGERRAVVTRATDMATPLASPLAQDDLERRRQVSRRP